MQTPDLSTPTDTGKLASLLPSVFRLARLAGNLAKRLQNGVLWLCLSGFLAAAWLGWSTVAWWAFSVKAAVIAGGVLALPALLLGWCWLVLDSAAEVPERLEAWLARAREYAGDLRQRARQGSPQAEAGADAGADESLESSRSRFSDLRRLGGLALELQFLGSDAAELLGILSGSLTLSNPLFLFALAGSAAAVVLLDLVAAVAALFF